MLSPVNNMALDTKIAEFFERLSSAFLLTRHLFTIKQQNRVNLHPTWLNELYSQPLTLNKAINQPVEKLFTQIPIHSEVKFELANIGKNKKESS